MKQGLVQDYSQRIEGANIYRQKLSRLKLYRLRLHRHRPGWAKGHGLRLYRQHLYGSETGVGGGGGVGGSSEIIYSSPSIRKKVDGGLKTDGSLARSPEAGRWAVSCGLVQSWIGGTLSFLAVFTSVSTRSPLVFYFCWLFIVRQDFLVGVTFLQIIFNSFIWVVPLDFSQFFRPIRIFGFGLVVVFTKVTNPFWLQSSLLWPSDLRVA